MTNCIAFLGKLAGRWEGAGINHEGQSYKGEITFDVPVNNSAAIIHCLATGTDGSVYHLETLMVGTEPGGACFAYSASNNVPGVVHFSITQPSPESIVFTLGDLADLSNFREVITMRIEAESELFHGFAWAMPGEPMQERSSGRLSPVTCRAKPHESWVANTKSP